MSTLHVIEDGSPVLGRLKRWVGAIAAHRAMTIAVSDAQRQWYLDMSGEDPAGS